MPRAPHLDPPEDSGAEERLRQFEESRGIEPDPAISQVPPGEDAAGTGGVGQRPSEADANVDERGEAPTGSDS